MAIQIMDYRPILDRLKSTALSKGTRVDFPENGDEILVIKEEILNDQHSFAIGVGKAVAFNFRYFDIKGKVFTDSFPIFSDSSLRIEPKLIKKTKGVSYITLKFPKGFIRNVDETSWQDKLKDLSDLIDLLENLGKKPSNSLFDDIKNLTLNSK